MKEIFAPRVISLYSKEDAVATLHFISQLYDYDVTTLRVNFSQTEYITAAASLVVLAHIHYIQLFKNNRGCFVFDCKKSPIYESFFIKGKYLSLLKHGTKRDLTQLNILDPTFRLGRVHQIVNVRKENLQDINAFLQRLKLNTQEKLGCNIDFTEIDNLFSGFRTALSEVLLNIKNHAYEEHTAEESVMGEFDIYREKLWWQMLWYSPRANQVAFIIYDLGLGIEHSYLEFSTIPKPTFETLPLMPTEIFREALDEGRSRFVGDGRGYGLFNITQFAKDKDEIDLLIFSGGSCYVNKGKTVEYHHLNGSKLTGTLVEWVFQLPDWSNINDE